MQQNINISTPDDGLGDALRDGFDKTNQNFTELYNGKVDKIIGKGLSENDFTDADKTKLDGIEAGAQVNVNADFGENDPSAPGYILNRPPSMYASVGYFDYNDVSTILAPLVLVSGVAKKLTNDTLGVHTNIGEAPYGVANIWKQYANQFDFSQLAIGDTLDMRVDALLTTTGTNKTYKILLKLGIGTPSEFTTLVGSGELKNAVTDENIVKEISFYIGSEDVRDAPAELYILVDAAGSVKVNGWYVRILRKGLNIIDITGAYLSDDPTTYTNATLPLTGTEVAILNDGIGWKKITWNNIKAWFDTFYQAILVSGTNIKTINGSSILGSGNLVVGGGEDFIQSQFQWYHFTSFGARNGVFNSTQLANGTVSQAINTSQIPNYQNIQQFNSSTLANSGYRIGTVDFLTGNGSSRFSKQVGLTYFTTFCIYSNSSADTIIRLGYMSSINTSAPTIGCFIEITGTTVVFKSVAGGVTTTSASATLAYSNTFATEIPYDALIHFDSLTQVSCKIVRHDGVVVFNPPPITTNIPGASALFHAMALGFIQTAGTVRPIFGLQKIGIGTKKPSFLNSF